MPSRRWVWVAVLLGAAGLSAALTAARPSAGEYRVYALAADRMTAGDRVYRQNTVENGGGAFTYPPFFALPVVPLRMLPEVAQRPAWYTINLVVLAFIIARLHRRIGPLIAASGGPRAWVFWLLVGLISARHVAAPLENQSHDLFVFLAVAMAIDAWCDGADVRMGIWAGLGAAMKATPLIFLPVMLWQRRWRGTAAMIVVATAATLLPDLLFPSADHRLWVTQWREVFISKVSAGASPDVSGAWSKWNALNQSLTGTIYRLTNPSPDPGDVTTPNVAVAPLGASAAQAVTLGAMALVALAVMLVTRPSAAGSPGSQSLRRLGEGGALACAMVLLSPMSSKAHFDVLLIPAVFLVFHALYRRRDPVVIAVLVIAFVLGTVTTKDMLGRTLGNIVLAYGSVTWCAAAMLVGTCVALIRRQAAAHTGAA